MNATEMMDEAKRLPRGLRSLHIGVANRGTWPLTLATPQRGFIPTALCDRREDALAEARSRCGLGESACYREVEEALKRTDLDCAIICAPTHWHVPLVKQCVAAGLPVLVEKGMAPSWEEACDLVAFVQRHGAKVAVAQNYRYRSLEREIARLLGRGGEGGGEAGAASVGELSMLIYSEMRVRPVPNNLTYPFASVWDMSCHHFDNLLSWLGPIDRVTAHAWGAPWSAYEHANNTSAHLVSRSGVPVHYIHTHDASRASLRIEAHGQAGAAVYDHGVLNFSERPVRNFGSHPVREIPLEEAVSEAGVLEDFYRYVVEDREPGISARQNLEVMALCQMMVLSIGQKRTVAREELACAASLAL